jgi:hypothetical protein
MWGLIVQDLISRIWWPELGTSTTGRWHRIWRATNDNSAGELSLYYECSLYDLLFRKRCVLLPLKQTIISEFSTLDLLPNTKFLHWINFKYVVTWNNARQTIAALQHDCSDAKKLKQVFLLKEWSPMFWWYEISWKKWITLKFKFALDKSCSSVFDTLLL